MLEEVKGKRRFTWILLSQNARVAELRNGTLLLALSNAGARDSFARGGNEDVLREAIVVVMGADFTVETMVDPSRPLRPGASRTPQAAQPPAVGAAADSPVARATNGAQNTMADDPDEAASRDDSDLAEDAQSHTELLARIWARRSSPRRNTAHGLGGRVPQKARDDSRRRHVRTAGPGPGDARSC